MIISDKIKLIQELLNQGRTMKEIGRALGGVSRQRIYQFLTQHNIETVERKKHGFWKTQTIENKWLWRILSSKKINNKWELFKHLSINLPTHCPILNTKLNYNSNKEQSRYFSPSVDRIDSSKGYEINNVHIISWRANRIKNDATLDELKKIYDYLSK